MNNYFDVLLDKFSVENGKNAICEGGNDRRGVYFPLSRRFYVDLHYSLVLFLLTTLTWRVKKNIIRAKKEGYK